MPYQCLKCGSCFAEGTTTILRGCPDCRGMRFFFTEEPLTQVERDRRLQESERNTSSLLEEITKRIGEPASTATQIPQTLAVPPSFQTSGGQSQVLPDGSLLIKIPKSVEQRLRRATVGWDYETPESPSPAAPATPLLPEAGPQAKSLEAAPPSIDAVRIASESPLHPEPHVPETVRIDGPGRYEIDVQRLLEKSPIVIQKDGTYLIHLPSLFDMPRKPSTR